MAANMPSLVPPPPVRPLWEPRAHSVLTHNAAGGLPTPFPYTPTITLGSPSTMLCQRYQFNRSSLTLKSRAGQPTNWNSVPGRSKTFFPSPESRQDLGPSHLHIRCVPRGSSPRCKATGTEANDTHLYSVAVNEWRYTSTPLHTHTWSRRGS